MSVTEAREFRCDICAETQITPKGREPKGWVGYAKGEGVCHTCETCLEKFLQPHFNAFFNALGASCDEEPCPDMAPESEKLCRRVRLMGFAKEMIGEETTRLSKLCLEEQMKEERQA